MVGKTLSHYKILAEISRGGMGVVYRALDVKLNREVALKVLPPELVADPKRKRRFIQEAQAAAALGHPNIAVVYETDEADGVTFMVMELIQGDELKAAFQLKRPSLERCLDLSIEIAEGLACAHEKGIVHRDLKPGNILVTEHGHAKIIDFGLAKLLEPIGGEASEAETALKGETSTGHIMGTVAYMSPEQARGEKVDHRSDIFSFGVVLYEMLQGEQPFQAPSGPEILNAIINSSPPPLDSLDREVAPELQRIADKCLAKRPADRYQNVRDLAVDLRAVRRRLDSGAVVPVQRNRRRVIAAAILAAVLLAVGAGFYVARRASVVPVGQIDSLAVLPLENLSGDPEQEYFADGMTEALIADLAKIGSLKIISRTSAMRYKGTDKSLPEIAAELNVDGIVEGSVLRAGNRVRITAQLIEATTDQHIWVESYERELKDILSLQSEVARAIAEEIQVQLTPQETAHLAAAATVNPEAHEAYLKGLYFYNQGSQTKSNWEVALRHFEDAVELDPDYALAYVGLANIYRQGGGWWITPEEGYTKAVDAVSKALEMDENLAEAHWTLCDLKYNGTLDWVGAKRECKRFRELSPGSANAHYDRGRWLIHEGRPMEAIPELEKALEQDPLNIPLKIDVGRAFLFSRDIKRASSEFLSVLELNPSHAWARMQLSWTYILEENYDQGITELANSLSLLNLEVEGNILERIYAESGFKKAMTQAAESAVQRSLPDPWRSQDIAWLYAMAGEADQAIPWMERAYEERAGFFLNNLHVDPIWDPIRDDPRFQDLVRRLNLPE